MGTEEKTEQDSNSESNETKEEIEEQTIEENNEEDSSNEKKQETKTETIEDTEEKKNTDELRKVIKVNPEEESDEKKQNQATSEEKPDGNTREGLEQKRAILQSIKDFDFQIKKNQEEITAVNQKLDSVTKDLDDLVSLYEIVSEQMNPFVGLSKVTKKRIDALENFTKVIEDLKIRMGDLESFAEKAGANLKEIRLARGDQKQTETSNLNNEIKPEKTSIEENYSIIKNDVTNGDLDIIIEEAFNSLLIDSEIDGIIDNFIENLKDVNIN
jgi:flagellar protein FlaC